jgi:hypothetical protein
MVRDEADGPRVHHGWSVFLGPLLEGRVAILDGPPLPADSQRPPRGQSAQTLRTVRLVLSRLPMSFAY